MRRLFIIRKDLNMKAGKLSAMIGHCAEAYWMHIFRKSFFSPSVDKKNYIYSNIEISANIVDDYINGIFTKTICEAKNLQDLKKVEEVIKQFNLIEGEDWGYINDCCLTDLTPENDDKTCTVGIWFKPLPDDITKQLSKKYKLYGVFDNDKSTVYYEIEMSSYCSGDQDSSYDQVACYKTRDEAIKHFNAYLEKYVKNNKHLKITKLQQDNCEYQSGEKWFYSLYIKKCEIYIRDKYEDLNK